MTTLRTFGKKMQRLSERIPHNANKVKRRVAVNVVTAVVRTTPEDSGRARASWNVNMNTPDYAYNYEAFTAGEHSGAWIGKLSTSVTAIMSAMPKDSIYISSGLPYIGKLNRGYSSQAPRGFVRTATIIGAREVRDSRILK